MSEIHNETIKSIDCKDTLDAKSCVQASIVWPSEKIEETKLFYKPMPQPQASDSTLRQILNELQNIHKRIDNLENHFSVRMDNFRKEIRDVKDEIIASKVANGKAITKLNNEMRELKSTFENLKMKMLPFTLQGSVIVELGINNAVRDYFAQLFLTATVRDIKSQTISSLNHATGKNNHHLLVFRPDATEFTTRNALTEFDGLFRLDIGGTSELIIVESKMIFTLEHIKHKYQIFLNFKNLLSTPRSRFANQKYYNSLIENFGGYDKITIVYGALHWEMQIEHLYLDDERVIYDPDHELYEDDNRPLDWTKSYPDMDSRLHPDVTKMTCAPDIKFVVNTINGFRVYNNVDCLSGGNSESDDT